MKKFCLLFSFLFLLIFTYSFKPIFKNVFSPHNLVFSDAEYSVYCLDVENDLEDAQIIENGNSFVIKTSINNAQKIKSKASFVMGESVRFKSHYFAVEKLIEYFDLKNIKTEEIGGVKSVIGFSDKENLQNSIDIDGNLVNIQIVFSCDTITIGSPIILGDY